jgi:hypothetical protein
LVIAFIIAFVVILGLFQDDCTQSFDRSPEAVVTSYLEAVSSGNVTLAHACWEPTAYSDPGSGCSGACLVKVFRSRFELVDLNLGEPVDTPEGGQQLEASIEIVCTESGATHEGDVILDALAQSYPWKHWEIVRSTIGGTAAEPWCQ